MRTFAFRKMRAQDLAFGALVGVIFAIWLVTVQSTGGSFSPFNQLVYLPILLAAHRWGWRGGTAMAVLAAFSIGPLVWLIDPARNTEDVTAWTVGTVFSTLVGGLTGWLFDQARRATTSAEAAAAELIEHEAELRRLADHAQRAADGLRFQASLLNEVQSVVLATDLDNRITYWNPAAELLYGWTSEEATGRELHELLSGDPDLAAIVPRSVVRDGRHWMGVLRDRRKDGTSVLTSVSAVPLRDADGRIIGGIGTASDITEQEAAAKEIKAAGRRLASVLDAAPDAIILIDGAGLITEWNRCAEHEYGWRRDEAIGRNAADLVASVPLLERGDHGPGALSTVAAGNLPHRLPLVARDRHGTEFEIELTMTPVGTPEDPSYAIYVTRTDTLGD